MNSKLSTVLAISGTLALSACLSAEQVEQQKIEYQAKHYAGKGRSGNPQYWKDVTAPSIPQKGIFEVPHTIESVRQIPVSELPKPVIKEGHGTDYILREWCGRDGFGSYKVVESKHNGDFWVRKRNLISYFSPEYKVTVECVR